MWHPRVFRTRSGACGDEPVIDLVEQAAFEELSADGRGQDLEVLASRGAPGDLHRFGDVAAEEGHPFGGLGIVGVVSEPEPPY